MTNLIRALDRSIGRGICVLLLIALLSWLPTRSPADDSAPMPVGAPLHVQWNPSTSRSQYTIGDETKVVAPPPAKPLVAGFVLPNIPKPDPNLPRGDSDSNLVQVQNLAPAPASIPPAKEVERPPIGVGPSLALPPELPKNDNYDPRPAQVLPPMSVFDAPLGFAGLSSVAPREGQSDPHFIPLEDRWRIGFPEWDRYGKGHPLGDDYPYKEGRPIDPYNQNVLKGDYPIIGQNIFMEITASSKTLAEFHQVPIPTTPFESTSQPNSQQFFGRPNQFLLLQYFAFSVDLFQGDTAFRPVDWRLKITPTFNINVLDGQELGVVSPDVRRGLDRTRSFFALQEFFAETKIADLSPNYDFVSVRAGTQPFNSDFRGFIFSDMNLGLRFFGNRNSNREQFNLAAFNQWEKDTNSGLNTFHNREQQVVIGNYYIQDFIFPGYTAQASIHYNHDDASTKFDKNNFLVRPDPVGVFQPHSLDIMYLGWTGDGHIGRFNINHAFYWALGYDTHNPMANRSQEVNAQFAALELSYDRDWVRFRTSYLYASGDDNPNNHVATGFDGIIDNPNFAGGEFSYWQRQAVRLFGVNLTNRGSFFPHLRSSKIQGQSNFVNPGIHLFNLGADFEITPKLRLVTNCNLMNFDEVAVLQQFVYQEQIHRFIGTDLSAGFEYRPLLNNNIIMSLGLATLLPGRGFNDIYDNIESQTGAKFAAFFDLGLTY